MSSNDRTRVLLFLNLLAAPESDARFRAHDESEALAEALCRLWIEEIYVPGIRNLDGLKSDRSTKRVADFEMQFTGRESELLYQFHRFLELRLEMLPKRLPEEIAFPGGEFWQNIFRHAKNVLDEIDPERLELAEILRSERRLTFPFPNEPPA